MAIELKLPRRRRDVTLAVTCCVLVLGSLIYAGFKLRRPRYSNVEYFTVDDGQSYFGLTGAHFPPFDYQGKEAVRAYLYKGSDGKPFVGYMMKLTPEVQQQQEKASQSTSSSEDAVPDTIHDEDRLFKRPGEKEWIPGNNPAAADIWGNVVDPKTHAKAQRWHER